MPNQSAGILLYRRRAGVVEVFLVHPGGPFWAKRNAGAWSIPKGEFEPGKDLLEAAKREFEEETGFTVEGTFTALQPVRQRGGKVVYAFAVEGDCDASAIRSNTFEMEWPPKSGRMREFPEVDRAEWFTIEEAMERINEGQRGLVGEVGSTLEPQG
jgi:predicted NUDIX family NTP pyrophosphohydrolase